MPRLWTPTKELGVNEGRCVLHTGDRVIQNGMCWLGQTELNLLNLTIGILRRLSCMDYLAPDKRIRWRWRELGVSSKPQKQRSFDITPWLPKKTLGPRIGIQNR